MDLSLGIWRIDSNLEDNVSNGSVKDDSEVMIDENDFMRPTLKPSKHAVPIFLKGTVNACMKQFLFETSTGVGNFTLIEIVKYHTSTHLEKP